jgi:hypothetical protein
MLTVTLIVVVAAFVAAVASAMNKAPLWVAVVLLSVALLLQILPIR